MGYLGRQLREVGPKWHMDAHGTRCVIEISRRVYAWEIEGCDLQIRALRQSYSGNRYPQYRRKYYLSQQQSTPQKIWPINQVCIFGGLAKDLIAFYRYATWLVLALNEEARDSRAFSDMHVTTTSWGAPPYRECAVGPLPSLDGEAHGERKPQPRQFIANRHRQMAERPKQ